MNTQKKRKLHGSVLLTVVFVMSILIVFLFGTMALALAANNRAHVNYSSAQTGITARSVAESAVAALDKNVAGAAQYKNAVGALKSDSTPLKVQVGLSNPGGSDSLASMGNIDDVTISYAGTKKFYDETKEEWLERDLLKFTSNVTMSGVTSSASVYVLKHDKEDNEGSGSGGAGFVTTAEASLATQTSIWGGAYIGLPKKDDAQTYKYVDATGNSNHSVFMGSSSNLIEPYDGTDKTALKGVNSGASIETPLYVCNNMYVENWSHFIFPTKGSGITVWGDMMFHNNSPSQLTYVYSGSAADKWNFNEIPYVYVDGTISGTVNLGFFEKHVDGAAPIPKNVPMNVFCGNIQVDNPDSKIKINGNIYCMDTDTGVTNKIKAMNDTALYAWTGNVINRYTAQTVTDEVVGDICSKGDLELQNVTIQGDVRVEGNLIITQRPGVAGDKVTVNGDVVVGGEIVGEENLIVAAGKSIYNATKGSRTVEMDNLKGTYDIYTPQQGIIEGFEDDGFKWLDKYNQLLNDGDVFVDGVFNPDNSKGIANPSDLKLYYTVETKEDGSAIDPIFSYDTDALCLVGGTDNQFYAQTFVTSFTDKDNYELKADYSIKVPNPKFEYNYSEGPNVYLNKIGESHIYPEYAEKAVILGDNDDTKVVQTIEEVLTDVANPYENKVNLTSNEVPAKISELMSTEEFKSASYLTKLEDITDADGNYVINKSCKLDMNVGEISGKEILIDPGSNHLLILVKNLTIDNGKIIVDDSNGGTVHIIIEETTVGGYDAWGNLAWQTEGLILKQTPLLTRSYQKLLNGEYGDKFKYITDKKKISDLISGTGYEDVKDLATTLGDKVKPNVNIYGTSSSYLVASSGYKPISANVISPDLKVDFASSGGNSYTDFNFTNFYYNNVDINNLHGTEKRAMYFGCLNSQAVKSANPLEVVFATDGGKIGDDHTDDGDPFWYKILYYSEF